MDGQTRKPDIKPQPSRKVRILDAAETLLAEYGFEAMTMRQVAKLAGVDIALASYHFGSKKGLFEAVMQRRADVLNALRREALSAAIAAAAPHPPSVEAIVDAFLRPILVREMTEDEGWCHYLELVAMVNASHRWGAEMMTKLFDPLVEEFLLQLRKVLPDASDDNFYWCYHFLSGALTLTFAQTGRIDRLSKGACRSDDLEGAYRRLADFASAGFKALCVPETAARAAE